MGRRQMMPMMALLFGVDEDGCKEEAGAGWGASWHWDDEVAVLEGWKILIIGVHAVSVVIVAAGV